MEFDELSGKIIGCAIDSLLCIYYGQTLFYTIVWARKRGYNLHL